MTRREARDLGREPGFVLRYANTSTRTVYLADYRLNIGHATHDLDEAEWFASLIEATDNVHRIRIQAHYNCEAMAEPGLERPRPQCKCEPGMACSRCTPCRGGHALDWVSSKPLLTAEDALHNAALHFLEEAGDDDEIARAIVGEAQRTAWGTIRVGEVS